MNPKLYVEGKFIGENKDNEEKTSHWGENIYLMNKKAENIGVVVLHSILTLYTPLKHYEKLKLKNHPLIFLLCSFFICMYLKARLERVNHIWTNIYYWCLFVVSLSFSDSLHTGCVKIKTTSVFFLCLCFEI